jgi:hypothetical protein
MPYIAGSLDEAAGAVIDVLVGVDDGREQLLTKHQFPIPQALRIRAQLDTGSAVSLVDPRILKNLDLTPIGTTWIRTPSTGPAPHASNQYVVSILLGEKDTGMHYPSVLVIEAVFGPEEVIQAVIGRDLLKKCTFLFDGGRNAFWFAF